MQPKNGIVDNVRTNPYLPLGILTICSKLQNYKIKIIDQRLDKNWKKTLIQELNKKPICFATTVIVGIQIKFAIEASKFVKSHSNTPIIWGGVHASLSTKTTLKEKYIDYIVIGDGEETFPKLVHAIKNNKLSQLKFIKGIAYKKQEKIIINSEPKLVNLNKYLIPYNLVNLNKYLQKFNKINYLPIQSSRGCPHSCTFCYNPIFNKKKWRAMKPKTMINHIKYIINNSNAKGIYFVDDNFFVDIKRAEDFIDQLNLEKIKIYWEVEGVDVQSIKKMSDQYLKKMIDNGLRRIVIGIESGSIDIRKKIEKTPTIEDIILINKKLSQHKLLVYYNFLAGFPGETKKDIMNTTNLIKQILRENKNARIFPLNLLIPFEGTAIFNEIKNKKEYIPNSLKTWTTYNTYKKSFQNQNNPFIEKICFVTFFIDNKYKDFEVSPIIHILSFLYQPIAKLRFNNNYYRFMIEKKVVDIINYISKNQFI